MTYIERFPIGRPVGADSEDTGDLTVAEIEAIYRENFQMLTRRTRSAGQYGLSMAAALKEAKKPDFWFHVLYLIAAHKYSYEETAEILDKPVGTIQSAFHRVKAWVKARPELENK